MAKRSNGSTQHPPCAVFVGDLSVGKSTLLNALLRREVWPVSREETRGLPAVAARTDLRETSFGAWSADAGAVSITHDDAITIRRDRNNEAGYTALGARLPNLAYDRLVLIDTPGLASESTRTVDFKTLDGRDRTMLVLVTDIEYWSAKHTMDLILQHHEAYAGALLVVGNKADHLNAEEIRRVADKAHARLEDYGIKPAPAFLPVSARLEAVRHSPYNEYRQRTKRHVRELCDAGFDALRVALYEFEAECAPSPRALSFKQLFAVPQVADVATRMAGVRT